MGYPPPPPSSSSSSNNDKNGDFSTSFHNKHDPDRNRKFLHVERVYRIACQLREQLRVVVEGQVSLQDFLDEAIQQCLRLKKLPLGAQIVRCVGRAYRHSGQKAMHHIDGTVAGLVSEHVREQFRNVKQFATAVVTSGRVLMAEQRLEHRKASLAKQLSESITYHFDTELGELTPCLVESEDTSSNNYDDDYGIPTSLYETYHSQPSDHDNDDHHRNFQHIQTQATLLESLQIEALWKVMKIELDKLVREACELILLNDDATFAWNHNQIVPNYHHYPEPHLDGWVGARSQYAITNAQGRRKAAEVLIQLGNVMVEQSKEGTSWLE